MRFQLNNESAGAGVPQTNSIVPTTTASIFPFGLNATQELSLSFVLTVRTASPVCGFQRRIVLSPAALANTIHPHYTQPYVHNRYDLPNV